MLVWRDNSEAAGSPAHYPHTHDCCELFFCLRGECSYMVENGIFAMPLGTVMTLATQGSHDTASVGAANLLKTLRIVNKAFNDEPVSNSATPDRFISDALADGVPAGRVSELCGFEDYSHFIQLFRRHVGMTTGQFVAKLPKKA